MSHKLPTLMELFAQLVAAQSVSCTNPSLDQSNKAMIDLLAGWFEALGLRVEVMAIPDRPGKFNLLARTGSGEDGLLLSGHTDTVPFDTGAWSTDPFRLSERDGRLYGLGTADMKGFFALIIEVLKSIDLTRLRAPLTILATADEESSMSGARALADLRMPLGRYAVIGEPTGLRPIHMHKGIMMVCIRLQGRSGHSSDPALGVSALEAMHRVITDLLSWRTELQQRYQNPLFDVAVPTLNLGHIHGGDNPNRICAECELHIDLRLLPGMDPQEIGGALRQRVTEVVAAGDVRLVINDLFAGIPALDTPRNTRIVCAAEALSGQPAGTVAFGTEGPFLNALGLETVILGPGSIAQAHQADEFIAMAELRPAMALYEGLIQGFCMRDAISTELDQEDNEHAG